MLEFTRIPTVLSADEIIEKAFKRASRISSNSMGTGKPQEERLRMGETTRLRTAQNLTAAALENYVRRFPSFNNLHPFYQELIGLLVDMDRTRKALGAVDWAAKRVNQIGDETVAEMKPIRNNNEAVLDLRAKAYGRISSIVHQVDKDLKHLNAVREELKRLPTINPDVPTIVVAGYPNVGKSSLIRKVSSAEPEVAHYPFTTKGIVIGHFKHGRAQITHQIIDTPGLLDRAFEERNQIELQAILALKHLGDVILFLIDPSEHCGYTLEAQEKLLASAQASFPETPFIVVENKADLAVSDVPGRHRISTVTGEGIDALINEAVRVIYEKTRKENLALAGTNTTAGMPTGVKRVPTRAERDAAARRAEAAAQAPRHEEEEDDETPVRRPSRRPTRHDEEEG
ncbi:MAG TPA: GTPase [Candidatus Thermoplasmatota archaeon]|nr:GTPase [Candidatus Thermoplasmatota archaeon]